MEIIGDHITECVRDAYLAEFQDDHAIDDAELTFLRTSLVDSCASSAIHLQSISLRDSRYAPDKSHIE